MDEILEKLKDKDEKVAYELAKKIGIESAESDKYVKMIPAFAEMLIDKNSYVRTRAFMLICNQSRWSDKGQIEAVKEIDLSGYKDSMSPLIKKDIEVLLAMIE